MSSIEFNNAGTWFLSYLCDIGIIRNDDTVQYNYVDGLLLKDWCDIPSGYHVHITMNDGKTLNIIYANPEKVKEDEEQESDDEYGYDPYMPWYHRDYAKCIKREVCLSFK